MVSKIKMTEKFPISGIVVGRNDGMLLPQCLEKLSFCDDLIYVDLQSDDGSCQIAEKYGAKVVRREIVPIVEIVHSEIYHHVKYPAILIADPDEVMDDQLIDLVPRMLDMITDPSGNIGAVYVPMVNYFENHRLIGTIWGGKYQGRICMVNRQRFEFLPFVHNGRRPKSGFSIYSLPRNGMNVVHHFWARDRKMLIEKHRRYILKEGEAQFKNGERTGYADVVLMPIKAFFECLIKAKGYKDGWVGIWLSGFWAWYKTSSKIQLLRYQMQSFRSTR